MDDDPPPLVFTDNKGVKRKFGKTAYRLLCDTSKTLNIICHYNCRKAKPLEGVKFNQALKFKFILTSVYYSLTSASPRRADPPYSMSQSERAGTASIQNRRLHHHQTPLQSSQLLRTPRAQLPRREGKEQLLHSRSGTLVTVWCSLQTFVGGIIGSVETTTLSADRTVIFVCSFSLC